MIRKQLAVVGSVVALAACSNESLLPPEPTGGAMFARYVSFGNSITAGFQSGGINDSTQSESYAALVAERMGTQFVFPALRKPGCPPPLVDIFTLTTLDDAVACGAPPRAEREPPPLLHNVAVPGAAVLDIITNVGPGTRANTFTTLLLGGLTQIEVARKVQPTFITVWIGNNDVLGAATSGDALLATPVALFEQRYLAILGELDELNVTGAVLIGVADVTVIPFLSNGSEYFGLAAQGLLPPAFAVAANCAPAIDGDVALVPFSYGVGNLLAQASQGVAVTLDCQADAEVLTRDEALGLSQSVAAFNQVIEQQANDRGWGYLNPNVVLDSLKQIGEVPPFPNVPPNPLSTPEPFGPWFSRDGVHPTFAAHRLVANRLIEEINATYGTSLTPVP